MSWVLSAAGSVATLESVGDVTLSGIGAGEILKWNGSGWINNTLAEAGIQPAGSYLANVVEDTTPQLGGNLETAGNDILLESSAKLRLEGAVDTIYTDITRATSGITVDHSGAGNYVYLRTGTDLRVYDITDTDYLSISHDGDNPQIETNAGNIYVLDNVYLRSGSHNRLYSSDNTDYMWLGTSSCSKSPDWKYSVDSPSEGGHLYWMVETIADDATSTFEVPSYYMAFIISTYNRTTFAHFAGTTTQAPEDLGSGSLVSIGSVNPDVDGNVNIWPSASGEFSIKNRLGSQRTFYVLIFGNT